MAGVRNYSHASPLSDPKGLPQDSEWLNSPHQYAYENNPMSGELIPYEERETNKQSVLNDYDYHSHSWLTLKELIDFDYSQRFEDRRTSKTFLTPGGGSFTNVASIANIGEGKEITYREHLGKSFMEDLFQLKTMGAPEDVRIVFWFDN